MSPLRSFFVLIENALQERVDVYLKITVSKQRPHPNTVPHQPIDRHRRAPAEFISNYFLQITLRKWELSPNFGDGAAG
jgi:hypothetical protein